MFQMVNSKMHHKEHFYDTYMCALDRGTRERKPRIDSG